MKPMDKQHLNRTGAALAPELTQALLQGTQEFKPTTPRKGDGLSEMRVSYAEEAEPTGSIPPPPGMKAALKTAVKALTGKKALVLADKLGERLAFERSGVRLYDALLSKLDAYGSWPGGPTRANLAEIREEERQHYLLVKEAIEELGADPTAVTPSANLHAVASKGLCAVLTDPRTNLREGLEAILVAELEDNDCWTNLIDLARALDNDELADRFNQALGHEREHLLKVRTWLGQALSRDATGAVAPSFLARSQEHRAQLHVQAATKAPANGRAPVARNGRSPRKRSTANRRPGARRNSSKRAASGSRRSRARK
jgi:rubrerythrin